MLKRIVLGIVLLTGLLVGSAWAGEALNNALFHAAENGDRVKAEALLSKGAEVNAKDNNGKTPRRGRECEGHGRQNAAKYSG